ncbi:ubiquinol-cytochrome c reductase cytochrome b subunit [Propioniciclava sinopodophylli]|uniref:Cytochrome bc1 complex cytochrome b subunit n=1 Tax=Propioniciclava sinopodophylli TaxID=1837344 RepID=A0A4Q9KFZ2_9ACTN|nr:ubiquinol-cytochrome c reductase cytochrome b subunit [Propioniciclava sinopodophylli]TBT87322.1 ubiquinol-cytochrome c reductase cytochrome b subunit [Propioniciclava sinopodophylli]
MAKPVGIAPEGDILETRRPAEGGAVKSLPGPAVWLDERVGIAKLGKAGLRKVFPDHWSFLLGEIALYSFIVLLLTGIFLTIWFKPSMAEVEYQGSYELMRGLQMSQAFESTLAISFDVRGGMLVRQIHHWAALLFMAAMTAHMLRVFFTGAFRKPREINWLIGVGLLSLGMIAGMTGYSLPDDLLSGTGLRFTDGAIRSIPLVGTWIEFFVFGGEYPGDMIIARFYMAHILLLPAILLGLIAAHMALLVYHKHTQFPGPGRTENNVVGYPLFPVYMAKAGGFFFIVFGALILMGATLSINQVWLYGPYNPAQVTAGSQPDWYMGWVEGAIRIMPGWESSWGSTTWSWNVFIPFAILMGILYTGLAVWPFVEAWLTGDKSHHNILDRPRNAPTRTALGVAGMVWYGLFWVGGGNDIIATQFNVSLNAVTWFLRIAVFVGPVIAFIVTKRLCLSLQRADRERVLHGSESGIIVRSPAGGYHEPHAPISNDEAFTLTQHPQYAPLEETPSHDEHGVKQSGPGSVSGLHARLSAWFTGDDIAKPTREEIADSHHHDDEPKQLH